MKGYIKCKYKGFDSELGVNEWVLKSNRSNLTNTYTFRTNSDNVPVSFESFGTEYFSHAHPDEYLTTYTSFESVKQFDPSVFDITPYGLIYWENILEIFSIKHVKMESKEM